MSPKLPLKFYVTEDSLKFLIFLVLSLNAVCTVMCHHVSAWDVRQELYQLCCICRHFNCWFMLNDSIVKVWGGLYDTISEWVWKNGFTYKENKSLDSYTFGVCNFYLALGQSSIYIQYLIVSLQGKIIILYGYNSTRSLCLHFNESKR